jgi:O-antigen/teichoic acid export membrane protein
VLSSLAQGAVSTAARLLTGVVLFVLLARAWGPQDFGLFMFWFTVGTIACLPVDYGFAQQALRELGRDPSQAQPLMARLRDAKLVLAAMVLTLFAAAAAAARLPGPERDLALLLLVAAVLFSFGDLFAMGLRGLGRFRDEMLVSVGASVLHFGLVVVVLAAGGGLKLVAGAFVASRAAQLAALAHRFQAAAGALGRPLARTGEVGPTLAAGLRYGADHLLTNLYLALDTVLVKALLGPAAVGVYQAGLRLVQGAFALVPVINSVYVPAIAAAAEHGESTGRHARALLLQLALVGSVASLALALFAGPIQRLLYGQEFGELARLLPLFGALLLLRCTIAAFGTVMAALGYQRARAGGLVLATALLAAGIALWAPRFELAGVLAAALVAHAALGVVYVAVLARRRIQTGLRPASAGILAATAAVLGVRWFW